MTKDRTDAALADRTGSDRAGAEIRLEGLTKRYPGQDHPAVEELSITIPAGEIVMFVGPSGCGKTTSLKMINRLIEPTAGRVLIDGEDISRKDPTSLRREIGYVIQGGGLLPHHTVGENVALVPGLLKWDRARIDSRVDELLDMVGLDPAVYRDRFPRELSGGQQQRVGVARGLAADPSVILMDEPFGAVDPITRQRLQDELIAIQSELGKTVVMVTHDIDEAVKLGDRILVLDVGARVAQYATPAEILADPSDGFVQDFVGSGTQLKQLTLARVADVPLENRPTARVGEQVTDVVARTRATGHDAVVVLDARDRPVEWVFLRSLGGHDTVPAFGGRRLETVVSDRSTLADALDGMLASSHGGVVVTQRGRYAGVVTYEAVTDHVRAAREGA